MEIEESRSLGDLKALGKILTENPHFLCI